MCYVIMIIVELKLNLDFEINSETVEPNFSNPLFFFLLLITQIKSHSPFFVKHYIFTTILHYANRSIAMWSFLEMGVNHN